MYRCQAKQRCLMVEGNIGAGKSTFLKTIGAYFDAQLVYEPHAKWQQVGGENLLDNFYKDAFRWAYTFQTYAFVTRVVEQNNQARLSNKSLQILERSVYSDRYCFARNLFEMGRMSELEWTLYQEWFSWLVDSYTTPPDAFIYLRVDPAVCYARLQKRNRSEEKSVPREYIDLLHQRHEEWLVEKKDIALSLTKVPVLILECNDEFEQNVAAQEKLVKMIEAFLQERFHEPAPLLGQVKSHGRVDYE